MTSAQTSRSRGRAADIARRIGRAAAMLILAIGAAGMSSGCDYVAAGILVIEGPPKVKKVGELPEGRSLVVFIDDPQNRMPRRSLREMAAKAAEEEIIREKLTGGAAVIESATAMRIASTERYGQPMSIVEIGRRVGADVVLYVRVEQWTLAREVGSISPAAVARVKLLDAKNNKRIWPDQAAGYVMQASLPVQTNQAPASLDARAMLEEKFARRFGLEIARLFFDHERDAVREKNILP